MSNLFPQTNPFNPYKTFIQKHIELNTLEWHLIKSKLSTVCYKKGDIIHNIGDVSCHNYFLNYGIVRSYLLDEKGKDYTWGIHFNDKSAEMYNLFVVDYQSFINQTPSTLGYEVIEDCELVKISYKDTQFLYSYFKKGEHFGRIMSELAYNELHRIIVERTTLNAKQRLMLFMKTSIFLMDKVPQYHIASYLGITPQSLSKLKKELNIHLGE